MDIFYIDSQGLNIKNNKDINLCLGFFDGVHLGHISLIIKALSQGKTGIMTFEKPLSFEKNKEQLTSLEDKIKIFENLNISYLYILKNNQSFENMSKDEFIDKILKPINPKHIFVGSDYRFGLNASGNILDLSQHFNVRVVPFMEIEQHKISSSVIIDSLKNGNVEFAEECLGRPYRLSGKVVKGLGNGRKISFPTANLETVFNYVVPKRGVYIGYTIVHNCKHKAIISIGTHPTIAELDAPIIEAHILDFDENIYGEFIQLEFVGKIRDIVTFDSLNSLKTQLIKDLEYAKSALK